MRLGLPIIIFTKKKIVHRKEPDCFLSLYFAELIQRVLILTSRTQGKFGEITLKLGEVSGSGPGKG